MRGYLGLFIESQKMRRHVPVVRFQIHTKRSILKYNDATSKTERIESEILNEFALKTLSVTFGSLIFLTKALGLIQLSDSRSTNEARSVVASRESHKSLRRSSRLHQRRRHHVRCLKSRVAVLNASTGEDRAGNASSHKQLCRMLGVF
jgi:hypothetical protein